MATTTFPATAANASVNPAATPAEQTIRSDTNISKNVVRFADAAAKTAHFMFCVPANYLSGNPNTRLRWLTPATSKDCYWDVTYFFNATNSAVVNGVVVQVTPTSDATGLDINDTDFAMSSSPAASRLVPMQVRRLGNQAADTLSDNADLLDVIFSYTSDPTITKGYIWIPAGAFAIPAASGATHVNNVACTATTVAYPKLIQLNDAANNYADARFALPENFQGNLLLTAWFKVGADTNAFGFTEGMGAAAVGEDEDPALTTGGTITIATGTTLRFYSDPQRAAPIAPSAGEECLLRITRDSADTNTGVVYLCGVLVEFDVWNRNPACLEFDVGAGSLPATDPASILKVDGTNGSRNVAQFANGATQTVDFAGTLPSTYLGGGTLRLRWSSPAASGNCYWRVDVGSPASGTASDPALTAGTPFTSACGGADVINECTVNISADLVAGDEVLVRVVRLGDDGTDTCEDVVTLHRCRLETTITP